MFYSGARLWGNDSSHLCKYPLPATYNILFWKHLLSFLFSFGIFGDLQLQTQKSNQSEEKPQSIISVDVHFFVNNTCKKQMYCKVGFVSNQILKMSSNCILPQKLENGIIRLHLNFLCPSCNRLLLQGRWKLLLAKLRIMPELFFEYQHAVSPLFLWHSDTMTELLEQWRIRDNIMFCTLVLQTGS